MTCTLLDLGCHLQGAFWGVINAVPWWVWLVLAIAGVGVAYKLGGWPAVAALAFGYGLFWGRKSAHDPFPHPDGEPLHPRRSKEPDGGKDWQRRKGETAAEWQERVSKTR